jgi:hypothetical protein
MSLNDEQKLAAEKSLRPNANNEIDYFALGDSFAHIRPGWGLPTVGTESWNRNLALLG